MRAGRPSDGPPDPSSAVTVADFITGLRRLRVWAGSPSFAVLRRRTGLPRTTLHDALNPGRARLPSLDLVRRLVGACDGTPEEIARWERAWRAVQEAQPDPATTPRPETAAPRQLPNDVYGFVGRDVELGRLDAVSHETRIVILCGTGGVGKTGLAVHWAHRVADLFPDGQFYLNLRGFSTDAPLTPEQALTTLLAGLGVHGQQVPSALDAQAALFRSLVAGRRLLVVLDNAGSAAQVRPLLPGSATCLTLVTSRHTLRGLHARDGADRLSLDRLGDRDARELLAGMLGAERVAREEAAIAELARLCAHLPLALRVAAANLADRPQATIASYVAGLATGDRLDSLVIDDDDTAVVATLDSSYAALAPEARRMFARLGLVPGPDFTVPALAALGGGTEEEAVRVLDQLTAAHLVESRGAGRYELHDLLRLYAARQARTAGTASDAALGRLFDWYLRSAANATDRIRSSLLRLPAPPADASVRPLAFADAAEALDWYGAEQANLVAAVHHAARHGPTPLSWHLADMLRGFFQLRSYHADWLTVSSVALAAAEAAGDRAAQAAMHLSFGNAWWMIGDFPRAAEHMETSLEIGRERGDAHWLSTQLLNLGILHHQFGRLARAADLIAQSLGYARELADDARTAIAQSSLGQIYRDLGRPGLAAPLLHEALGVLEEGDQFRHAGTLAGLNMVYRDLGDLDTAAEYAARSLTAYQRAGSRRGEIAALDELAQIEIDRGDRAAAEPLARRAVALARETGDDAMEGAALTTLGIAMDGPDEVVAAHLDRAARLGRDRAMPAIEIPALVARAGLECRRGNPEDAVATARRALAIARQGEAAPLEAGALTALAEALLVAGDPEAPELARRAAEIYRACAQPLGEARALAILGRSRTPA